MIAASLDAFDEHPLDSGAMLHREPAHAAADALPTEPSAADRRRAARARLERQMAVLDRLAEIGLAIAEAAGRQACAPAGDAPQHDPGLTYARAARAVRLTIALQTQLAKDLAGVGRDETEARRSRIRRLVERAIEAACDDEDEIERLSDEARERLWEDEDLDELAGRPIGEAVALICSELGLSPAAWAGAFDAPNLPPLGEVPPNGRGRGLQGATARVSALQPPSSASRPLPPRGEETTVFRSG